jgi:hypothetical protein
MFYQSEFKPIECQFEILEVMRIFNIRRVITSMLRIMLRLVWCPGQNKRIASHPFFDGCRKRRVKD